MKEKILYLRSLGKTYDEISNELGCSKGSISYYCNPLSKQNNRHRVNRYRKSFKEKIKLECGGKCKICGYNKCLRSLVFHHLDPSIKEYEISKLLRTHGKKAMRDEIKKCVLLCSNCHGEVHDGLISIPVEEVSTTGGLLNRVELGAEPRAGANLHPSSDEGSGS